MSPVDPIVAQLLPKLAMVLCAALGLPAPAVALVLGLMPQLENMIPEDKLIALAKELAAKAAKDAGPVLSKLGAEAVAWLRAQKVQPSGPADYGGNEPAKIDWGPDPKGPATPPPDSDFTP